MLIVFYSGKFRCIEVDRQTTSFIENSTEAGILLGGNGILYAMMVALSRAFRIQPSLTKVWWLPLTPLLTISVSLLSLSSHVNPLSLSALALKVFV